MYIKYTYIYNIYNIYVWSILYYCLYGYYVLFFMPTVRKILIIFYNSVCQIVFAYLKIMTNTDEPCAKYRREVRVWEFLFLQYVLHYYLDDRR